MPAVLRRTDRVRACLDRRFGETLVRLLRIPEATRTLLAVFGSIDDATNAVSAVIAAGLVPAALEMMDAVTLSALAARNMGYPEDAGAVLLRRE